MCLCVSRGIHGCPLWIGCVFVILYVWDSVCPCVRLRAFLSEVLHACVCARACQSAYE